MISRKLFEHLKGAGPFMLVMLYIFGFFNPAMEAKGNLMGLDLSAELETQSSGSLSKQLFWVLAFVITFAMCFLKRVRLTKVNTSLTLFVLLLLFLFVSSIWSDYSLITLKRAMFQLILIGTLFFSIALLQSSQQFTFAIYCTFYILLVFQLIFMLGFSQYAFDAGGSFTGIQKGKNQLGVVAFFGVLVFLHHRLYGGYILFKYDNKLATIGMLLWFSLLILSRSKTCILLTCLISIGYISTHFELSLRIMVRSFFKVFALFFFVSVVYGYSQEDNVVFVFERLFEVLDLTGRGEIWGLSLQSILDNPMLGYGYSAFWGVGEVPIMFDIEFSYLAFLNQSHNGYLDVILQLGVLGFCLFILFLFYLQKEISQKTATSKFYTSVLFFVLLHNFTESSFVRDAHFSWVILLLVFLGLNLTKDRYSNR